MGRRFISVILILVGLSAVGAYQYWSWVTREPISIRYGYPPYADSAPLYVAVEKGFFKEENLNVSLFKFFTGVKTLEAATAGNLDGGFVAIMTALPAFQAGVDFRFAGSMSYYDIDHDLTGYFVLMNSSIQKVEDFRGKTFAVRGIDATVMIPLLKALEKHGLTVAEVKVVVIRDQLDIMEALLSGSVDVAHLAEPVLTQALGTGKLRIMYRPYTEVFPDHKFPMATSFFMKSFIDQNKTAVDGFIKAFNRAVDWIGTHPWETKAIIANWTGMDLELAGKMTLHAWSKEVDREVLEDVIDLLLEYGYLEKDIAAIDVLYQD